MPNTVADESGGSKHALDRSTADPFRYKSVITIVTYIYSVLVQKLFGDLQFCMYQLGYAG